MRDYKIARKWASEAGSVNIGFATARRHIPHHLTFNTMKQLPSTKYPDLPPMPRLTPRAIRSDQDDCSPQPEGNGPMPRYDNVLGFRLSPELHEVAANASVPPGYIQNFAFANSSFFGTHYLGHYEQQSYDPLDCAKRCNEWGQAVDSTSGSPHSQAGAQGPDQTNKTTTTVATGQDGSAKTAQEPLCQGFNIYFERSPAIHLGPECRQSESRTIIKCALWAEPLRIQGATNAGYREWDFDVAIAGSNGYSLEKYAKVESMASGTKTTKAIVGALFIGQLVLAMLAF